MSIRLASSPPLRCPLRLAIVAPLACAAACLALAGASHAAPPLGKPAGAAPAGKPPAAKPSAPPRANDDAIPDPPPPPDPEGAPQPGATRQPAAADEPGYLGAVADDRQAAAGVRIVQIVPNGPAERGGLRVNDLITSVNGKPVKGMEDLAAILLRGRPGDKLKLAIERGVTTRPTGNKATLEIVLGVRPPENQRLFPQFGRVPETYPEEVEVRRPSTTLLGVRSVPLDGDSQQRLGVPTTTGAVVTVVAEGSPAALAKIPPEAVIVEINGQRVASPDELVERVLQAGPGSEIEIAYYIGEELIRQPLTLAGGAPTPEQRLVELERLVKQLQQRIEELERKK